MRGTIIKCSNCGALNRVLFEKIHSNPRCGKCNNYLNILDRPLDINFSQYIDEVENYSGYVLLDLWSPT
ncbi:MAG: hypothetical protein N2999_06050 [Proteobacteria bacterium]|nr:hypothetical protein [Pseudomonadota bacterium]